MYEHALPRGADQRVQDSNTPRNVTKVVEFPKPHRLCPDAEKNLAISIRDDAVILINGNFLFKVYGKGAALAVCSNLEEGIQGGEWYTPEDSSVLYQIQEAYIRGETQINFPESTWAHVRKMSHHVAYNRRADYAYVVRREDEILNLALQAAEEMLKGNNRSTQPEEAKKRREYWQHFHKHLSTT